MRKKWKLQFSAYEQIVYLDILLLSVICYYLFSVACLCYVSLLISILFGTISSLKAFFFNMWLFLCKKRSRKNIFPSFFCPPFINHQIFLSPRNVSGKLIAAALRWWIKGEQGSASTELSIQWKTPRRKQKITSVINGKTVESQGAMKPQWRDTQQRPSESREGS